MKRLFLVSSFLFFLSSFSISQNLVPNESFEEVTQITNRWIANHIQFEELMEDWLTPNQGTPDIFFSKVMSKMSPVRKGVDLSQHKARTGEMMVGFKTYGCETFTQHCKEYLQIKLKAPVEKGKKYYVEFYVQPIVHSIFTNNIGMAFSDVEIQDDSEYGLYYLEPAVLEKNIIAKGLNQWHKISDTITADANYEYIIFGNFLNDSDTKISKADARIDYSYYLMDDILFHPVVNTFENNFTADKIEVGQPVVLKNILFETAKATLQSSSFTELNALSKFLMENPELTIDIIGHTDDEGDSNANYKLSESRAFTVMEYLVKKGVDRGRMNYEGYGEDRPVAGNDNEKGRAANRRVEFVVIEND